MDEQSYDYIIIGGGTAGCVLANRLSLNHTVCLLEAGPYDRNPFIRIPFGIILVNRSNTLNWKYWTVPQVHCNNRSLFIPRGRTLGGSSAINAMCYSRGNPLDYDHWASLGNNGWDYQSLLPYFINLENYEPASNELHGKNNPLNVAKQRYVNPLVVSFVEAAKEAGYPFSKDFSGQTQDGVGVYDVLQKNGERCSSAQAFLRPAEKRDRLTVKVNAHVTKILLNNKKAFGVVYSQQKISRHIFANKEIILAAGSIVSPQLLLLSGIGAKDKLKKHHIPCRHDLPGVGENLQDHLDIDITTLEKTHYAIRLHPSWFLRGIINTFRYIFKKKGEFTSNIAQGGGFIKTDMTLRQPDLQLHFLPAIETQHAQDLKDVIRYYGYTLKTCFLQPFSRGTIELKNANPHAYPLINPNYLSDERDLDRLTKGFKLARNILSQDAFLKHRLKEYQPGASVQSDNDIKEYIRAHAETIYHPVGTCKMGKDEMSVVDDQLRVHGIDGLRIIDASIMPTIVSGNTNVPTVMIAEKGADMIINKEIQ